MERTMKERACFTLDKKTIKILESLVKDKKFRNKSHAVEETIRKLWA
jgi:Arc/MetJ-type ribon-helix-helix transcriptional regulator